MAAFRVVDPFEVFTDNLGNPCAGGSLVFYDTLTTTAKNVYSDQALSVNLGNTLTLNSAGRATTDVWGSGSYRVLLKNSAGVTQEDVDPILEQGAAGSAIPSQTGNTGEFLTTNGAVMSWVPVTQIPAMSGQSGKVLGTDGTAALWQPAPVAPTVPALPATGVANTSSTVLRVGTAVLQTGTGTLPATGTTKSTVTVTFGTAMASCSLVVVQMESTLGTYVIATKVSGKSGTQFSLEGDTNIFGVNFNSTCAFTYLAFGVSV